MTESRLDVLGFLVTDFLAVEVIKPAPGATWTDVLLDRVMGPLVAENSIPLKSNKSPATKEFSSSVSVVFLAAFFRTGFAGGAC